MKEDLSLIVAAFGVYAFVLGRRRLGIFLVAVGAAAFGLLVDVIVPAFAGGAYPHWSYKELGSGGPALRYVITHPIATLKLMISPRPKLVLVGAVFLPGALLSLLSPIVILAVPALLERAFSQRSDVWSTGFQYSAPLAPIVGMAVIDGLWRARRWYELRHMRPGLGASPVVDSSGRARTTPQLGRVFPEGDRIAKVAIALLVVAVVITVQFPCRC